MASRVAGTVGFPHSIKRLWFMYLLEYLEKRLTGDAWTIGRQLMYLPWHCDLDLLKPHIPRDVFVRFAKVQRYCRSRIQPGTKARILGLRFRYVALDAFVVTSPTQFVFTGSGTIGAFKAILRTSCYGRRCIRPYARMAPH